MRLILKALSAVVLAIALTTTATADGDVYVNGYFKKNGTYVQPYYRTAPNNSVWDNYSTQGNVNPYTGQPGTKNPYNLNNGGGWNNNGGYNGYNNGGNNSLYGTQNNCAYSINC